MSSHRVSIIIDTREMKDQDERTYFQETLTEKYKIDVETHALAIGDFVFAYDGEILDYVVERKKADDLAASITDGRYKEQKYRLKNCGAGHVIYLYEGYPSEGSLLKEKELMNALLKTRVSDGFMVYRTVRIGETARLLAELHGQLEGRISGGETMLGVGSL
jgi:crossover junction endonuclease MUS81